jgi:cytidyltransferase-like protein
MRRIYVAGAFDDPASKELRQLYETSRHGSLTLLLESDAAIARRTGKSPKMNLSERRYFFEAIRFVDKVEEAPADPAAAGIPLLDLSGPSFSEAALTGFPYEAPPVDAPRPAGMKRVVVTGCYDYFHSGHVRFFEEASEYGELNVVIGSDKNVRLLKGEGHPLFPETIRRFVVGSCRYVARCLVSSGKGWLDAEPEIQALEAERYVVNEDGDKPEKREYCERNGIEYIVLKRTPKEGLPRRSSTDLRGY